MILFLFNLSRLPPLESKPSTEDILNAILPPREWD